MMSLSHLLFFVIACLLQTTIATHVETFSDSNCGISLNTWTGPNEYPDGRCTSTLKQGNFTSFKIVYPDPGCLLTVYAQDTSSSSCSGAAIVAEPTKCYNSTWQYSIIDQCCNPSSSSSSAATTGTRKPAASSSKFNNNANTSAIAGGIVGAVVFVALAAGIATFSYLRRRRIEDAPPPYSISSPLEIAAKRVYPSIPPPQELPQRGSVVELQSNIMHELPGSESRLELGLTSPLMSDWKQQANHDKRGDV